MIHDFGDESKRTAHGVAARWLDMKWLKASGY